MGKKTKQTEERLLKELRVKGKKAKMYPDKFSCINNGTLLTGDNFNEEIKKSMVELYDIDKEGFFYIRLNPKIQRDALHYLIDKTLNEYPEEVIKHKTGTPELNMRDFIKRYYSPIIFPSVMGPILFPNPKLKKQLRKGKRSRFRDESLRDLEIYRLRCIGTVIQFPAYKNREKKPEGYRQTVKKKSFIEIGAELGIKKADAVRKAYSKAYELIHGAPYKKGVKARVQKTFLKKECGTCKDRPFCKTLCPDILSFVDQDTAKGDAFHRNIRKLQGK